MAEIYVVALLNLAIELRKLQEKIKEYPLPVIDVLKGPKGLKQKIINAESTLKALFEDKQFLEKVKQNDEPTIDQLFRLSDDLGTISNTISSRYPQSINHKHAAAVEALRVNICNLWNAAFQLLNSHREGHQISRQEKAGIRIMLR